MLLLPEAVGELEERRAVLGGLEDEGGGLEDGRLGRALGPLGLVPVAHHEALGVERALPDPLVGLLVVIPHGTELLG